eukprot:122315-Chlamydomonas_euryale.AAC.2
MLHDLMLVLNIPQRDSSLHTHEPSLLLLLLTTPSITRLWMGTQYGSLATWHPAWQPGTQPGQAACRCARARPQSMTVPPDIWSTVPPCVRSTVLLVERAPGWVIDRAAW